MPRRFRINGPLLLGILAFAAGIGIYIAFPFAEALFFEAPGNGAATTTLEPALVRQRVVTCVTGLWFFVFGATIGSFSECCSLPHADGPELRRQAVAMSVL